MTGADLGVEHGRSDREALFRALGEESSDILFSLSGDGVVCYVSPSITRVLGYPTEQVVGTKPFDLVSAAARSVTDAMQSISAVVEENTASTEEMAAQSGHVSDAIQSIAAVSEEQSASTEEASASAEEMSAQAQELAATAEQLRSLLGRFTPERSLATQNQKIVALRRVAWAGRSRTRSGRLSPRA